MPIELGRLQQAHHYRGAISGLVAADEQPVFSVMIMYDRKNGTSVGPKLAPIMGASFKA